MSRNLKIHRKGGKEGGKSGAGGDDKYFVKFVIRKSKSL